MTHSGPDALRSLRVLAITGLLLIVLPSFGAAQTVYSVTPTFEWSVTEFSPVTPGASYRSWGIMAGRSRVGQWWQPHLWFQRYELDVVCPPDRTRCGNEGWSLSVGPAIDLMRTPDVVLSLASQVGVDSRWTGDFTGGGGVHVRVRWGRIQPQAFGRIQWLRGGTYGTVGVGLRFEFLRRTATDRSPF